MTAGSRLGGLGGLAPTVLLAAGLVLAGCGSAPPAASPSQGAVTPTAVPSSAVPAGLGPPMDVPLRGLPLRDVHLSTALVAGDGTVWAIADRRGVHGSGTGTGVPTGVWHGDPFFGEGLWYGLGSVEALALDGDGTPWAVVGTALTMFDGASWRRVLRPDGTTLSGLSNALTVDAEGTVWGLAGAWAGTLVSRRSDGVTSEQRGPPPPCLPRFLVAESAGGALWSGGSSGWVPREGCLLRRGAHGAWVPVRPLGRDVPVSLLAAGENRRVWAVLQRSVRQPAPTRPLPRQWLVRMRGDDTEIRTRVPAGLATSLVASGAGAWVLVSPSGWSTCDPQRHAVLYRVSDQGSWSVARRGRLAAVTAVDAAGAALVTTCAGGLTHVPDEAG